MSDLLSPEKPQIRKTRAAFDQTMSRFDSAKVEPH
jgi:hypothetical protein